MSVCVLCVCNQTKREIKKVNNVDDDDGDGETE